MWGVLLVGVRGRLVPPPRAWDISVAYVAEIVELLVMGSVRYADCSEECLLV